MRAAWLERFENGRGHGAGHVCRNAIEGAALLIEEAGPLNHRISALGQLVLAPEGQRVVGPQHLGRRDIGEADLHRQHETLDINKTDFQISLLDSISLQNDKLNIYPDDSYFYELLSKAYAKEGKELLQYQAQSEAYYRKFNLPRAIEQMEFAVKSKDGNFYQKSIVESRLKQLKFENSLEDIKDKK